MTAVMAKLTAVFSRLKDCLKRKEDNPRIKMLETLQSHYKDQSEGGLSLTNKVRQSVGLTLVKQAPLTDEQYQNITATLLLTEDKIKQKEDNS